MWVRHEVVGYTIDDNDVLCSQCTATGPTLQHLANSIARSTQPLSPMKESLQQQHTPVTANISIKHSAREQQPHPAANVSIKHTTGVTVTLGSLFWLRYIHDGCFACVYMIVAICSDHVGQCVLHVLLIHLLAGQQRELQGILCSHAVWFHVFWWSGSKERSWDFLGWILTSCSSPGMWRHGRTKKSWAHCWR